MVLYLHNQRYIKRQILVNSDNKTLKMGGDFSWKVEHQGTVWGQPCDMLWKLQNSSYTVWVLRIYISYSYVTTTNNMLFAVSWWQSAWNARRCAGGYTLQHNIVKILQRGYLTHKQSTMSHPETCIRIRLIGHLLANRDFQPTRSARSIYILTNTNEWFLSKNFVLLVIGNL